MNRTRRIAALISLAAIVTSLTGCCLGGPDFLNMGNGGTSILWGDAISFSGVITVSYDEDAPPAGDVVEVHFGDTRIPLTRTITPWENASPQEKDGSCPHTSETYVLEDDVQLDPGTYQLVHRRKNGNGHAISCSMREGQTLTTGPCPWTTFDGDEALIATFEVAEP